jgi:hypothetical protein
VKCTGEFSRKKTLAVSLVSLIFSVAACKNFNQTSTTNATIIHSNGDVTNIDLSTFIARRGECDLEGGFQLASKANMRYSEESFRSTGKTLMLRNTDEPKQPLASLVTEYEMGLLVAYTGGLFGNINSWLRGDKDKIGELARNVSDAEWSRMALCMSSAINKLARYQGGFNRLVAFRGTSLSPELLADRYQKGKMVTERSFQSYSFDKNVAIDYSKPGNNEAKSSVLFVLQGSGTVGFNIEPISSFPEEKELLVNADHKFCILNVAKTTVGEFVPNHQAKTSPLTVVTLSVGMGGCGG